jgi:hypothetical protein
MSSSNVSSSSSSPSTSSSTATTNQTYESSMDQLRSMLPNSTMEKMSDYDIVRSATDYIQTLINDTDTNRFSW